MKTIDMYKTFGGLSWVHTHVFPRARNQEACERHSCCTETRFVPFQVHLSSTLGAPLIGLMILAQDAHLALPFGRPKSSVGRCLASPLVTFVSASTCAQRDGSKVSFSDSIVYKANPDAR